MKNFTKSFLKFALATSLAFASFSASAATYTAVNSGNFNASSTWMGGVAPSSNISLDQIIIQSGVTVTMTQSVSINGALAVLDVDGSLVANAGTMLSVTVGTLTGSGVINADSLKLGLVSGLTYTGDIIADVLVSTGATFSAAADVTVDEQLILDGGILNIAAGSLSLSNGATIVVEGGTLDVTGLGALTLNNSYNVTYTGSSSSAGLELSGSGLSGVTIAVSSGNSVTLNSDLDVDGTLTLTSGTLVLNGNDLTFSGNGSVATSGSGTISSSNASNIMINTTNSLNGELRFAAGASTVNDLTIDLGSTSASANLGSNLTVDGTLDLQTGLLNAGSNTLTVGANGSLSGGSANSFVITGNNGRLAVVTNAGDSTSFHIGANATTYAPVKVKVNTGSSGGTISAGVVTGVQSGATTGTNLALTQPVVNATWFVSTSASSNVNMTVSPMWSVAMEVNSFNRSEAYVSTNTNGTWTSGTTASAATTVGTMYTINSSAVTSSSAGIAVVGKNATNSVEGTIANASVNIYPNPVANTLRFDATGKVNVTIYNIAGQVVKSATINNQAISVEELPAGYYNIRLTGDNFATTQKFVKQ
jgi:hypothetical protein